MKNKSSLIFLLFFFAFSLLQILAQNKLLENKDSSYSFKKNLEFLASDLLEGRKTGSRGADLAAEFLAEQVKNMSLKPGAKNNSYFQNVPIHESISLKSSKLILYNNGIENNLELGKDYLIYKPGEQTFIPARLPLVFVGYGIVAPEFDYNDYQSVDVEGKIVVMLSGEPNSNESNYFNGEYSTLYSYPEAKQRIAISRGASGSIIIPNPNNELFKSWDELINQFYFQNMFLAYSVSSNLNIIVNPMSANLLFRETGFSLNDIYEMDSKNKIRSFPLKTELVFKGEFKETDFISSNVTAILPGSDEKLKDTYFIISAHYDHLGIGSEVNGDSIYNGVFDNAAGVAAVLEIAKTFSELKVKPKRSILFLFLTGEEEGLLGSTYYSDFPIIPLYKTIANINVDGISLFDRIKSIVGVGAELSTLKNFLELTANKFNLKITDIPPHFEQIESYSLSDQIAFAQAGIPAILLMEGGDYENLTKEEGLEKLINYSENIYHTPFDDLNQYINYNAADQFIKIIFDLCSEILNSEEVPQWNDNSPFKHIRLKTFAEKR